MKRRFKYYVGAFTAIIAFLSFSTEGFAATKAVHIGYGERLKSTSLVYLKGGTKYYLGYEPRRNNRNPVQVYVKNNETGKTVFGRTMTPTGPLGVSLIAPSSGNYRLYLECVGTSCNADGILRW
ncbi:hypothetical protein COF81_09415 [Bacillus pseudomycoides]|uniref:Uncharacterized protein n=1 Tax=Bacillus pseudomycoides TaxID=64104 RepID=A0ABD6T979_9BACI|nr:hypothetical protein [Bacillus pseudomycoides]PHE99927.1 hypothetical protein COF81_09415 [Bacillus pseudomycoides]